MTKSPLADLPEDTKFFDFEGRPVAEIGPFRFAFDPDKRPLHSLSSRENSEPCTRKEAEELWALWSAGK